MMMYNMFVTRMVSAITTLMTLMFMNAMVSFTTRHGKDVLDNYNVHVHKGCPAKVGKPIRIYFGINVRYLIKFFTDLDIRIFGMLTFVSVSMSISIFMSVSSSSS
jgi:hypothetical protein